MPVVPGQTLSHYRLLEKIGEGGMGVVWKAEDLKLHRTVALKTLRPELLESEVAKQRFLREARAAAAINHPNVATVHEVDDAEGTTFISMEYVEGKSLSGTLRGGSLAVRKIVSIAVQIAEGLARAHRAGVVHRDLKPGNVMIGPDERVKILDFGLAKSLAGNRDRGSETITHGLTGERHILGTVNYMSPEQARGSTVDTRSDLFSFGATLYEMLTGRVPFERGGTIETLHAVLHEPASPARDFRPEIPDGLESILARCLEKDPARRYQDTRDLVIDLKRLIDSSESSAPSYGGPPRTRTTAGRRRKIFVPALGGLLVLALAVTGMWLLGPWRAIPAEDSTILILPFLVHGQPDDSQSTGVAVAEAIAVNLARARELTILPLPETSGSATEAMALARSSGAGRVLRGTLSSAEGGFEVQLTLLHAVNHRILWGTTADDSSTDLSGLAAGLAKQVAAEMGVPLGRSYSYPMYLDGDPEMLVSADAIEALRSWRLGDVDRGQQATERLVVDFPTEIGAHALNAHLLMQSWASSALPEARAKLQRVLAAMNRLDPENPYGPVFTAYMQQLDASYAGDDAELRARVLETVAVNERLAEREDLTPACRAWLLRGAANFRVTRGLSFENWHLDAPSPEHGPSAETLASLEEAVRLDPANPWGYYYLAAALHLAGRTPEAVGFAARAADIFPSYRTLKQGLGRLLVSQEQWQDASAALRDTCTPDRPDSCAYYAVVLKRAGRDEEAREQVRAISNEIDSALARYHLARYWALSGDRALALEQLGRSRDLGLANRRIVRDPELETLRGDPEFEAIVAEVKKRIDEQ